MVQFARAAPRAPGREEETRPITIEFTCKCGRLYRVSDALAGRKATCKNCQSPFVIPAHPARAKAPRAKRPRKLVPLCVGAAIVLAVGGLVVSLIAMSGSGIPDPSELAGGGDDESPPVRTARLPAPPDTARPPAPPETPGRTATATRNPTNWDKYRSPFDLAFSPDGKTLAVSDRTAGKLILADGATGKVTAEIALRGQPTGLAWRETDGRVLVCEYAAGTVAEVDPAAATVARRVHVAPLPMGVACAGGKKLIVVTNHGTNTVSFVDAATGRERVRMAGFKHPYFVTVTPDASLAAVGNLIPAGAASDEGTSASITLIDLAAGAKVADIRLPAGGALIRGLVTDAEGKWLYAAHVIGRTNVPTTQLEQGWINTDALTIVDLAAREIYATLLLDRPSEGAADPWGVAIAPDGKALYVTISGVHQIARIDLANLHKMLAGEDPDPAVPFERHKRRVTGIWPRIKKDPKMRHELVNNLVALYSADLIRRVTLRTAAGQPATSHTTWGLPTAKGPRGVAVSADGKVAVACYFAGQVLLLDADTLDVTARMHLGDNAALMAGDPVRRGEQNFHDAGLCFQHWLSCATCHPDGRADGMNWDLLNDGVGTPKNTKSLFLADRTPPSMSTGVRSNYETASAAGFRHILFRVVDARTIADTQAYIRSMPAVRSPYLAGGKLSPRAAKGKTVFERADTGCATCHPGALLTDLKMYDVGTRGELDRRSAFDTPTLREVWRTAPYLHDGSAATLRDVLTTRNKGNRHGRISHLKKDDLDAMIEYLRSL